MSHCCSHVDRANDFLVEIVHVFFTVIPCSILQASMKWLMLQSHFGDVPCHMYWWNVAMFQESFSGIINGTWISWDYWLVSLWKNKKTPCMETNYKAMYLNETTCMSAWYASLNSLEFKLFVMYNVFLMFLWSGFGLGWPYRSKRGRSMESFSRVTVFPCNCRRSFPRRKQ